ncbi:uncharacterized protein G2W53_025170 [Senna tora]|uniref:Uncharacterized protein n=1 Tax=Senna tora TaxID=362788 RepID=A0A834TEW8_9FABA|nr:uncharacterized protein G2W53_025170 [Senna tora]
MNEKVETEIGQKTQDLKGKSKCLGTNENYTCRHTSKSRKVKIQRGLPCAPAECKIRHYSESPLPPLPYGAASRMWGRLGIAN